MTMSAVRTELGQDPAVIRARKAENVAVGEEIVRHRLYSRVVHWFVAITFLLGLATGLPIWTPVFGWMAHLFGGLSVCRILHPYVGAVFTFFMLVMFLHWAREMRMTKEERSWIGPRLNKRMDEHHDETGKYNAGQKLAFFLWFLGALGLLLTGIPLW